jgi:glycerol-3-phosphate dehydrogenase (NAD(P)+)
LELAAKHDVEVPIIEHVSRVIHEQMTVGEMVRSLMSRDPKPELSGYG